MKTFEAGWWMLDTTVRPSAATDLSVRIRAAAVVESRPEVGSSSSRMDGSVSISVAMLTRFFSPPLQSESAVFRHLSSPSVSMVELTAATLSASDVASRSRAVKSRVSYTVSC